MPLVTLAPADADSHDPSAGGYLGDEAAALLRGLGVECGHWPAARQASWLPHLRHARALADLQRRFPTTRVRWLRGAAAAADGHARMRPHGEIRVVLQGQWRVEIAGVLFAAPLRVTVGPLEWIALPAWLPHTIRPGWDLAAPSVATQPLELLVLELATAGVPRPEGVGAACAVPAQAPRPPTVAPLRAHVPG